MSKEFWDQRYSKENYAYGVEPNAYFKSFIDSCLAKAGGHVSYRILP